MGNGVMSRNRSREVVVSAEGLEQTRPGCKRKDRMEGGGEMATDEDEEVIPPLAENDLEGGIPGEYLVSLKGDNFGVVFHILVARASSEAPLDFS